MLASLDAVGPPLACLDDAGAVRWSTASFAAALGPLGQGPDGVRHWLGTDWAVLCAQGTLVREAPATDGAAARRWRLALSPPAGGLRWLSLVPADDAADAANAEPRRLAERLALIEEFGRTGYFERDPRTGEGWWDAHMFRLWGLPEPAGGGAPAPSYESLVARIHPADREPGGFMRSTEVAGLHDARIRVQHPDGRWRHVHAQWRVQHDAQGRPLRVVGIHTDDTEVYEKAQATEQTLGDMEAALAFAQIGLWRQDLATGHVWPDRRACELLGLPYRDDGYPMAVTRAQAHPDDMPALLASYDKTVRRGEPSEAAIRYPRPGGGWRHTLTRRILRRGADGEPTGCLGVMIDVTRLVEQARDATEAVDRIVLAQQALGLGMWHGVVGSGEAWWDEQMFRLRGVQAAARAVQRDEAMSYVHPDDRHRLADAYRRFDAQPTGWTIEYRVVWPDGTVRWLASRSRTVGAPGAGPARHFGVNWDVTDAHVAEQALRESARARAESEAKTQFLSRMSHELRTPLNAVLGFTQLMKLSPDAPPAERARWLDHVDEAGRHLLALIDDVLDLARADVGQLRLTLQPTRADDVVASALALVSNAASDRQVVLHVETDAGTVLLCDPVRLRQVLLNLLSNAIKYNRRGGRVWVTAAQDGGDGVIRVTDEGPGLTPAQIGELFRPFHRLGAERSGVEGTGIGLSIAKMLVDHMGGRIAVHSEPGQGCTFEVRVPLAGDTTPPPAVPPEAAADAVSRSAGATAPSRVLYVEDNAVNAMLLTELLRSHDDVVLRVAETASAGIDAARAWQPHAVLVDMRLPDGDGFTVLRALRGTPALADVPCAVLSASAMPDEVAAARAAGFDAYWTKPIQLDTFVRDLRALLASGRGAGAGPSPDGRP